VATVVNPALAKRMAAESPIPDEVPVTNAIFDMSTFSFGPLPVVAAVCPLK
jgi:hypothetical protein